MATATKKTARDDAEIERIVHETEKFKAETARLAADTSFKLQVEVARIVAETEKINRERSLYPAVILSGLIAAISAAIALALRYLA